MDVVACIDVLHRLMSLGADIVVMEGLVSDDAGRAGNEQIGAARLPQHARARERRAVCAEFWRVKIGARLPRIFDHRRRRARSQKVDGDGASRRRTQGTRRRHGADRASARIAEGRLPRRVEMAVSLIPIRLAVDRRHVIPHADQMPIRHVREHGEDILVRGFGRAQQRHRGRSVEAILADRRGTEQKFVAAPVLNAPALRRAGAKLQTASSAHPPNLAEAQARPERGGHAGCDRDPRR